jgi:hypothetical protein
LRFLLRFSRGKFFAGWVVKGVIFAQKIGHGNFHHLRKSKEFVTVCNNHVMSIPKGCGQPGKLWKTPVEKPVKNVEKCELSTGIWGFAKSAFTCGKVGRFVTQILPGREECACYVTGRPGAERVKTEEKSSIPL